MQEKIYGIIAIMICVVACVWGWWFENGPVKEEKKSKAEKGRKEKEVKENEKN